MSWRNVGACFARSGYTYRMITRLAWIGHRTLDWFDEFGRYNHFMGESLRWFFGAPRRWGRPSVLFPQLYAVGTRSIPVVMLVGAFVGMVLVIESYYQMSQIGQESRIGGLINIAVVKQIGPVLAAVMIAGRVGGSFSAELGTMRVTEQIDALRVMGTDPIAHLVVPRVVSCMLMVPVLTVFSDILGIYGAYAVAVHGYGVNRSAYWQFSSQFIQSWDVLTGLLKSAIFGLAIGWTSCFKGFNCRPGAAGVGRAATDAFVTSFIAIIVINFFLAKFFRDIYVLIFQTTGPTAF